MNAKTRRNLVALCSLLAVWIWVLCDQFLGEPTTAEAAPVDGATTQTASNESKSRPPANAKDSAVASLEQVERQRLVSRRPVGRNPFADSKEPQSPPPQQHSENLRHPALRVERK